MKSILLTVISLQAVIFFGLDLRADFDDCVREKLVWENKSLANDLSNYTVAATLIAPFGFALSSPDKRQQILPSLGAFVVGELINRGVKVLVHRERPNKENFRSFYSGHTTAAFTGAGIVCLYEDPKFCGPMLALSTSVGYFRIAADKHFFSDVTVGATMGYFGGRFIPTIFTKW